MTRRSPAILAVLATIVTGAGCGGPRFDPAAAALCEGIARPMPGSRVTTAFVTTLGRIRDGGYDIGRVDPWLGLDDDVAATVCSIDTPSFGGADSPSRMVVAITKEATGSKILDFGPADTLPLPMP